MKIVKIALSTVVASTLLLAAEPNLTKDDAFKTHTELGYIQTSGNTKTKTFNLDAEVKKGWGKNIFGLTFDGQYADDDGVENKNKFLIELEYNYEFTKRFSFNYLVGYRDDKFSGFSYQMYTGPGAKYKAIMTPKQNLSLEGNILYSVDEYDAVYTDPTTGSVISYPNSTAGANLRADSYSDSYMAYRLKGDYSLQMLENLKFTQELSLRGSVETTQKYFVFSKTAFTSKLSDMFSAGVSYKVDYANRPAEGKASTDSTFTFNLIVDY